jgi:hypothetical protein
MEEPRFTKNGEVFLSGGQVSFSKDTLSDSFTELEIVAGDLLEEALRYRDADTMTAADFEEAQILEALEDDTDLGMGDGE